MSLNRDKSVSQLVTKYLKKYPNLDRDLVRKLVRLENPELFFKNASNLRKLDRHLKKQYDLKQQSQVKPKIAANSFYEKRLEAIRQANLSKPFLAYIDLLLFIDTLPSHIQNSLGTDILVTAAAIKKSGASRFFEEQAQTQKRKEIVTSLSVLSCVNKISMLLNQEELK